MSYENYLLGYGTREDGNPLLADALVLSINPDGEAMLGFFEGLHPHASGGSIPISRIERNNVFDEMKLARSNALWMGPLIELWGCGGSFDLEDVLGKYREVHNCDPESTRGRFSDFPTVRSWLDSNG